MGIDLSVTGSTLLISIGVIVLLILVMILLLRRLYAKRSESGLASQAAGQASKSPLEERAKYRKADVFKHSGTFFNLGLALAVGITVLAFSWTQYEEKVNIPENALEIPEEIQVEPPRTAEPPPPPPPPPPPKIEEVPEEELLEEEEVEFEDMSIDEETVVEAPPPKEEAAPPPPPPPPPEPKTEEIFKVVEQMPRFPGCEDKDIPDAEKKSCAEKKMLEFIYKNIDYPAIARENGVEGTVVVQFVVEKDGSIQNARVVRDIGAQCGQEALRVVNLMNDKGIQWIPGRQRGRPVRVQFNLPIRFKLE